MDPNTGVVVASLIFVAVAIGIDRWASVQAGHRAVEAQQDFTSQLVNGLGVANQMGLAGAAVRQMGSIIEPDGRQANGHYQQRDSRVPDGFQQHQRPAATATDSR